jgi:hypothetical protein
MRRLPEPFGLLYVLVVSRCDRTPVRYQSLYPTSRDETSRFLKTYCDFLEGDGRHQIWVMSLPGESTLVYDNHDVIYAYGPLEELQHALEVSGLARGPVELLAPHQHRYNPEFDDAERRILGHWPWLECPLQPGDDP